MASLKFLWVNRAKFSITSIAFYRAWAKRLLTLPDVIKRNYRRNKLVSRGASIHHTAEIGVVKADGHKNNLTIGENSFLGMVELALHDKIIIGNNVCINDDVKLLSASHDVNDALWRHVKAPIIIQDYAWVATNAIILPGVTIGKGAVVGAGAVVNKNVEPYTIVVGNPAKQTSRKRDEILNYNPCEFLAGNRAWLIG